MLRQHPRRNLRKPGAGGLVYSIERGRMCPQCHLPMAKCSCAAQARAAPRGDGAARVSRESKGRGGKTVTLVRSLAPRHRTRPLAHLLALGDDDRHLRLGQVVTDEQIRLYARHVDFDRDEVFGIFDARLRLVAMARLAFAANPHSAEFGLSALAHQRGRGFGKRLFEHAVVNARNRDPAHHRAPVWRRGAL
jgi:GNAT superfamily N-acetyltransferase